MIELEFLTAGDYWINREQIELRLQEISQDPDVRVLVNMGREGSSMTALGMTDMLLTYLRPQQVKLRGWSNSMDPVPFERLDEHRCSHFFWLARRYWSADPAPNTNEFKFAAFVGRLSWPRLRMMRDLKTLPGSCLFSLMQRDVRPFVRMRHKLDAGEEWMDPDDTVDSIMVDSIIGDTTSLDGRQVRDQYDPDFNTNLSLAAHYHRFGIELVSETYTRGACYLPTEKTVRPLLFRKPIMIYGPKRFLQNLRDQGFRTWGDFWDESYDQLEGLERWSAMWRQIQLLDWRNDFQDLLARCADIAEHNRQTVFDICRQYEPGSSS